MTHPSMEGLRDHALAAALEASNCEHRDQSGTASYECSCDTDAAIDAVADYLSEHGVLLGADGLLLLERQERQEVAELRELLEAATGEDTVCALKVHMDALGAADDTDERWKHLVAATAAMGARAVANGRWAVAENRRAESLARKAEAGEALYEWLIDPSPRDDLPELLAQWESANSVAVPSEQERSL